MARDQLALFHALPEDYTAFRAVDREQGCLNIRRGNGRWEWVNNKYLLRVAGNNPAWSCVTVAYTFLVVQITGRNLMEVAEAIAANHCDFIQEHDAEHWLQPKDTSAAFIDRIEVIANRSPEQVFGEMEDSAGQTAL
jgi:hypothetical protein